MGWRAKLRRKRRRELAERRINKRFDDKENKLYDGLDEEEVNRRKSLKRAIDGGDEQGSMKSAIDGADDQIADSGGYGDTEQEVEEQSLESFDPNEIMEKYLGMFGGGENYENIQSLEENFLDSFHSNMSDSFMAENFKLFGIDTKNVGEKVGGIFGSNKQKETHILEAKKQADAEQVKKKTGQIFKIILVIVGIGVIAKLFKIW